MELEKKTPPKINIRITPNLKQRYDAAITHAGISMTQHLTSKILEFVQNEEKRMSMKALETMQKWREEMK